MKTLIFTTCFLLVAFAAFAQDKAPRLEAYTGVGLFFEQLNSDTLIPEKRRDHARLGDQSEWGLKMAIAPGGGRFLISAGLGYSLRHYSINKNSFGDIFDDLLLFNFDSRPRPDTFALSKIKLTNQYLQVPVSIEYTLIRRRKHGIGGPLSIGINLRNDILVKSSAALSYDSAYMLPTPAATANFQKLYTQNATGYVLTVQPYIEGSFFIYKGIGLFEQFRPLSYYCSPLDKKFTDGTVELFSFTVGLMYDFNR